MEFVFTDEDLDILTEGVSLDKMTDDEKMKFEEKKKIIQDICDPVESLKILETAKKQQMRLVELFNRHGQHLTEFEIALNKYIESTRDEFGEPHVSDEEIDRLNYEHAQLTATIQKERDSLQDYIGKYKIRMCRPETQEEYLKMNNLDFNEENFKETGVPETFKEALKMLEEMEINDEKKDLNTVEQTTNVLKKQIEKNDNGYLKEINKYNEICKSKSILHMDYNSGFTNDDNQAIMEVLNDFEKRCGGKNEEYYKLANRYIESVNNVRKGDDLMNAWKYQSKLHSMKNTPMKTEKINCSNYEWVLKLIGQEKKEDLESID